MSNNVYFGGALCSCILTSQENPEWQVLSPIAFYFIHYYNYKHSFVSLPVPSEMITVQLATAAVAVLKDNESTIDAEAPLAAFAVAVLSVPLTTVAEAPLAVPDGDNTATTALLRSPETHLAVTRGRDPVVRARLGHGAGRRRLDRVCCNLRCWQRRTKARQHCS